MKKSALTWVAFATAAFQAAPALATEGAMGRSISGAQITPYIGIIPPDPGLALSLSYIYYDGTIGASRETPVAGTAAIDLEGDVDLLAATLAYVWDTGEGRWNFASMLTVPYIHSDVSATIGVGDLSREVTDSSSGLFDLYFAPVIASYHVSQVEHWSFGLYVYAPTADYTAGALANNGLNIWTVSPAVGYTHLFQQGTFEFSALAGVDFYSKNEDTDYQNGAVFRLDALVMKRLANGWGFGAAAGWIEQIEDDSGDLADRLNGFRGHSIAVGPAISYAKHWSKESSLSLTLRWLTEFDVKNRREGDPLELNISLTF